MIEFLLVHWDCKELVPNVAHRSKVWSQQMSPEHPALPPKAISAEKYTILKYQDWKEAWRCAGMIHILISPCWWRYNILCEGKILHDKQVHSIYSASMAFSGGLCTGTRFECLWGIKFHMPYNMYSCGHAHTHTTQFWNVVARER